MKADITVPLSLVVAAAAAFWGSVVMYRWISWYDLSVLFVFRFFSGPVIVILLVLVPAAAVLVGRLVRHRGLVTLRRGAAYSSLIGTLIVLVFFVALSIALFSEDGSMREYWPLVVIVTMLTALPFSVGTGAAVVFVLTKTLALQPDAAATGPTVP